MPEEASFKEAVPFRGSIVGALPPEQQDVFPIAELELCNLRGQFDISADAVPSATTNHVIRGRASFCRVVGI